MIEFPCEFKTKFTQANFRSVARDAEGRLCDVLIVTDEMMNYPQDSINNFAMLNIFILIFINFYICLNVI